MGRVDRGFQRRSLWIQRDSACKQGEVVMVAQDAVQPYKELRQNLARRDRSLREKVVTLEEAASFVRDGASVGIGGSTMSRTPMALIWQLIRARKKELSCSRCIISTDGDLLLGSGVSNHIVSSWFAQGILWGLSKVMRHHIEGGHARYDEWSHMGVGMRFRAGAMGANRVILTTERIVSNDQIRRSPDQTKIPFFCVDAVVEVPFGSAPHECYGVYEPMMNHLETYVKQVNGDPVGGMKKYLDQHVYGLKNCNEFLS